MNFKQIAERAKELAKHDRQLMFPPDYDHGKAKDYERKQFQKYFWRMAIGSTSSPPKQG